MDLALGYAIAVECRLGKTRKAVMTRGNGVQLDYQIRPAWHRRRLFRRIVMLAFAGGIVVCSILWGPRAWRRASILYYQYQCETYTQPPDKVVYEPDPTKAAVLVHQGLQSGGYRSNPRFAFAPDPPCLSRLAALSPGLPPGVYYSFPAFTSAISTGSGCGFMHELRNHKGDRRLVVIAPPSQPAFVTYCITPLTRPFGSEQNGLLYMDSCYPQKIVISGTEPQRMLRIFAGQIDSHDPSHFTFAYECNEGKGTIDGWLTDDCLIKMSVRDGPAFRQPKPSMRDIDEGEADMTPDITPFVQPPPADLIDDRPR